MGKAINYHEDRLTESNDACLLQHLKPGSLPKRNDAFCPRRLDVEAEDRSRLLGMKQAGPEAAGALRLPLGFVNPAFAEPSHFIPPFPEDQSVHGLLDRLFLPLSASQKPAFLSVRRDRFACARSASKQVNPSTF